MQIMIKEQNRQIGELMKEFAGQTADFYNNVSSTKNEIKYIF